MNRKKIVALFTLTGACLLVITGMIVLLFLSGGIVFSVGGMTCSLTGATGIPFIDGIEPIYLWIALVVCGLALIFIIVLIIFLCVRSSRKKKRLAAEDAAFISEQPESSEPSAAEEEIVGEKELDCVKSDDELDIYVAEQQIKACMEKIESNELVISVYENEISVLSVSLSKQLGSGDYAAYNDTKEHISEYKNKIAKLKAENDESNCAIVEISNKITKMQFAGTVVPAETESGEDEVEEDETLVRHITDIAEAVAKYKEIYFQLEYYSQKLKMAKVKASSMQNSLLQARNLDTVNSYSFALGKLYKLISKYENNIALLRKKKVRAFAKLKELRRAASGYIGYNDIPLETVVETESKILVAMGVAKVDTEESKEKEEQLLSFENELSSLEKNIDNLGDDEKLECMLNILSLLEQIDGCRNEITAISQSSAGGGEPLIGLVSREQMRIRSRR